MIRFALNRKYLSSNAYRALGNFLALPSKRTLCDYSNVFSVEPGVSNELIQRMKSSMKFDSCADQEKIVGLSLLIKSSH
jgi:pantoate kinase